MNTLQVPLLTLGAGNMAHAIIAGAQSSAILSDHLVGALDPSADRRDLFPNGFAEPTPAAQWLSSSTSTRPLIMLAVKPQILPAALPPLIEALIQSKASACTFVSILAGIRIDSIRAMIRPDDRIIRVMPNTPAQIGLGMSAIANDNAPNEDDLTRVRQLFEAVGEVIEIPESLIDAFTAVAGSGPAYSFYLAEGMTKAAESIGFTPKQASIIVRQTILGSATLLTNSTDTPAELRSKVTSKNGTTYAATTTLDEHGVMEAIVAAITAARDRGIELGNEG